MIHLNEAEWEQAEPIEAEPSEHDPRALRIVLLMLAGFWCAAGAGVYFAGRAQGWWA